jgi:hypothetical protein
MFMPLPTYSFLAKAAQASTHIVGDDVATARGDVTLVDRHAR